MTAFIGFQMIINTATSNLLMPVFIGAGVLAKTQALQASQFFCL